MRRNSIIAIFTIAVLTFAAVFFVQNRDTTNTSNPAGTMEALPTGVNENANIKVTSPSPNEEVGNTFNVIGQARVFENVFQVRVTRATNDEVLYNQNHMADAKDVGQFGDFNVPVTIAENLTPGESLILEVFQFSAKDGSEVDKVTIPLVFK